MKKTTYKCDRCGAEIADVAYTLTCYADDAASRVLGVSTEVAAQNMKQNIALMTSKEKHLCGKCKDELTDGLFIV